MNTQLQTLYREFLSLEEPDKIHQGILSIVKNIEYSILYIGLALVKIKTGKLYRELGYKHMSAYVQHLVEETEKDRSSIYKWLQIGEIYLKYREKLDEIGFTSKDSPTKLPYLERALKNNPVKEVYENIKKMNQREFSNYARAMGNLAGNFQEVAENAIETTEEIVVDALDNPADEWGYTFFYKEQTAVKVNKKLSKRAYGMLLPAIRVALNALNRRGYVIAVHLDNHKEYVRYEKIALEAREKMRQEMRVKK